MLPTICFWLLFSLSAFGADPGKEAVARLRTILLYGSDRPLEGAIPEAQKADSHHSLHLQSLKNLKFSNYGILGSDVQPVWRSYTNWASPMKGSEEILLSFEPDSQAGAEGMRLDLELWQSKRKIMKTTQPLKKGKWLYIAGPDWRGGRLIVGIELLPLAEK